MIFIIEVQAYCQNLLIVSNSYKFKFNRYPVWSSGHCLDRPK